MSQATGPLQSGLPSPGAVVERVWLQRYRVPFRAEFVSAHGVERAREGVLIGVETAGGAVGFGEAAPLPRYTGGSVEETVEALRTLGLALLGQPPVTAWDIGPDLPGVSAGSAAAARCGIETASGDLLARAAGLPFSAWLARRAGGSQSAPLRRVPVNGTVDAGATASAVDEAQSLVARGFRTLKLKVGVDPEADFERTAAIRERVGASIALRIDANGGWTVGRAVHELERYAKLGVTMCEQPISHLLPGVADHFADIGRGCAVPIAADESCRSVANLNCLLAAGAVYAAVIKPMACGLKEALAMLAVAEQHGLLVIVTTMFEPGIGVAAAVHLAALLGHRALACGLATLEHLEDDLIDGGLEIAGGNIAVPQGAGLGVTLDIEALTAFATGPREWVAA